MSGMTATCPECGARFRLKQAATASSKIRCARCKYLFRPMDDEDDFEEAPRPRSRGRKKNSRGSKAPLIIGGVLLLLLLVAGGAVAVILGNRGGGASPTNPETQPPGPIVNPLPGGIPVSANDPAKVTLDNFYKVQPGSTRQEAEAILSTGDASSLDEIRNGFVNTYGRQAGAMKVGMVSLSSAKTYSRWTGNGVQIWVGYGKDSQGADRVCYSVCLHKKPDGSPETIAGVSSLRSAKEVDNLAAKWEEEKRLYADPRFKRGKEAERLLPGTWWTEGAQSSCHFKEDGTYEKQSLMKDEGRWKMTGPDEMEQQGKVPGGMGRPLTHKVLVSKDELHIYVVVSPFSRLKLGPYYRITSEGGGLFQEKLLDPLIKKLQEGEVADRRIAIAALTRLRTSATAAASAVVAALKDEDPFIRRQACQLVGWIGPPAKAAVPRLMELVKEKDTGIWAVIALGSMGPEAREALPLLQELAKTGDIGVKTEAQNAIKRIQP